MKLVQALLLAILLDIEVNQMNLFVKINIESLQIAGPKFSSKKIRLFSGFRLC
jgi:hypothetical protein